MGILSISAKSSDLNTFKYTGKNGKVTKSGDYSYVPYNLCIGGGDYVEMDIDMETGQILNWKPVSEKEIIKAIKDS